jgi:hydrogenase nickel incorporation protein HypA/HybF
MHEASIAQNIIDSVDRLVADGVVDGRVRSIRLRVGKLTAVVPDNLAFIFSVLAKGGELDGAALEFEEVGVRGECGGCAARFDIEEACFVCPSCGSGEVQLLSGRELVIDSVEVE